MNMRADDERSRKGINNTNTRERESNETYAMATLHSMTLRSEVVED